MVKLPSILEMLQAGAHFGHQTIRRHPKMNKFIFAKRNSINIINLEKTQEELEKTLAFVSKLASEGKNILFVTSKPQAREIVKKYAIDCDMPYLVDRWLGGLITNFTEIKKLLDKYRSLKEQRASGELEKYTKKEQVNFKKQIEKMDKNLAGLEKIQKIPDAIFVPALQNEKTAVTEAIKMNVPVIGIADTNANPDKADFVIPANDDAISSIEMMVKLVAEAVKEGSAKQEKVIGKK